MESIDEWSHRTLKTFYLARLIDGDVLNLDLVNHDLMRIYCNISGRGSSSKNRLSFRCGKCPAMTSSVCRQGLFGGKPRNLMRPPHSRWMATSSSKYNGSLALQGQRRGDFLCLAKVSAQDLLCYSTDHRITHMLVADFESIPLAEVFSALQRKTVLASFALRWQDFLNPSTLVFRNRLLRILWLYFRMNLRVAISSVRLPQHSCPKV